MRPCHACEEVRQFIASVGSPSDNRNRSMSLLIMINFDRYNFVDGRHD